MIPAGKFVDRVQFQPGAGQEAMLAFTTFAVVELQTPGRTELEDASFRAGEPQWRITVRRSIATARLLDDPTRWYAILLRRHRIRVEIIGVGEDRHTFILQAVGGTVSALALDELGLLTEDGQQLLAEDGTLLVPE